ncbi:MAG TPA: hypothetical protein VFN05_16840 [Actinomycetes bacterium]|nr:hypothetical protein [Actinomycetes bacterium]
MPPAADLAGKIALLGHTDQGGRGDGVQIMVGDGLLLVINAVNVFAAKAFAGEPPPPYRAGMQVYALADPFASREVGVYVPGAPERLYDTRPSRSRVIQSCDVFVDRNGVMYVTDYNAGLSVLQYEPGSS